MEVVKSAVHGAADCGEAYMDVEHSETTDSGVQLLDSTESTEMNASMVISGGFDDEEEAAPVIHSNSAPVSPAEPIAMLTNSDIENSNIPAANEEQMATKTKDTSQPPDEMISSQCSTFDTNDSIVFRRRTKKTRQSANPPKKRVSFHEDILKNTKTDNIHIEHGFITYKNGVRCHSGSATTAAAAGRYSWCSKDTHHRHLAGELQVDDEDPEYVIYRNACSEVLDYGKTDIYDGEGEPPKCDNSGVFEYARNAKVAPGDVADSQNGNTVVVEQEKNQAAAAGGFYKCQCSDSNSSLESNAVDVNSNQIRGNYAQTKSSSCDCIGSNGPEDPCRRQPVITDNCYYSEPNIGTMKSAMNTSTGASVWSKEKKPKSSCLKKTKHADFVQPMDSKTVNENLQKFNIHPRRQKSTTTTTATGGVNQILDNGKSIFGSLKNIFSLPLPERGVPEGQEDAQAVHEATPDSEPEGDTFPVPLACSSSPSGGGKSRSFLSKSFDGGFHENGSSPNKKRFIHSVDEQLRKKSTTDDNKSSPKRVTKQQGSTTPQNPSEVATKLTPKPEVYRNKFIINCESTVFEHTGISYTYEGAPPDLNSPSYSEPPKEAEPVGQTQSFLTQKISKWTNMFRKTNNNECLKTPSQPTTMMMMIPSPTGMINAGEENDQQQQPELHEPEPNIMASDVMECSFASTSSNSNSTMTDVSSLATSTSTSNNNDLTPSTDGFSKIFGGNGGSRGGSSNVSPSHNRTPTRHLASPLRKRSLTRVDDRTMAARMSPDLFSNYVQLMGSRAPMNDLRTSSLLSEDFDDILTITTNDTADRTDDMVIVDYPEITIPDHPDDSDFLKPASSKSSLINRFLRNVTQKKIMEATIALNKKLVSGNIAVANGKSVGKLYVKGVKPLSKDLIEDLNAEIAMEIEKNTGKGGDVMELVAGDSIEQQCDNNGFGVGEIPVEVFKGVKFPFIGALLPEFLMKVFKLYIGYNREGIMTPVLVFLTNKTLYVTDLVRSTLCNKFVMPYSELDVILLGPYGNTVLLCNGARDMQQVLLAGGPNQANALVSNLEICARRGGLMLPSIGQLTLDHLAPLQNFVRDSSKTVDRRERWLYYAVVSISPLAAGFSNDGDEVEEQLGANINGPLMHRSMSRAGLATTQWSASYFLLKAGVLYMFNTCQQNQKLPSWAVTLTECQGVRRLMTTGRPHCFELLLKTGAVQFAASDEYSASDWMQALVQSASGLFELEEKQSHYGCTLVLTSSHIITLREDFTEPLKRVAAKQAAATTMTDGNKTKVVVKNTEKLLLPVLMDRSDSASEMSSSTVSTPNRTSSSVSARKTSTELLTSSINNLKPKEATIGGAEGGATATGYSKMFSQYGKDSGMDILSCADIGQLISVKVSNKPAVWWCSLEFSCQECVQANSDDVVVHFATASEHERFLTNLQDVWRAKTEDVEEFPLQRVVEEQDTFAEHCTKLFTDINKLWDPLVTAARGYPK